MKKLIAAMATAGLLIVGTAGVATAADSPSTTTPSEKATSEKAQGHRARRIAAIGKIAAATIGIEPQALREAVKGGQSVAEVAQSHGVEPQAVVDAIVASVSTRVDEAVTAGKIDADRAATIKEKAPERVTKLVNAEYKGTHAKRAKLRRHARRGAAVVAAKTIGIEPSALRDAVKGGQSVADVATSHDVEPQAVIDAVVSAANTRLDAAVSAGKVKAERATKIKAHLTERVTKLVNATPRERD
jgi:transposase-like protein